MCKIEDFKLNSFRSLKYLLALIIFELSSTNIFAAKDLTCEEFKLSSWFNHGEIKNIKTCFMKTSTLTMIKTAGNSITSATDENVEGINLSDNRNVRFLPENLARIFPNLISYDARSSSIESISQDNFRGLKKLVKLYLENNLIRTVVDDTFADLAALEYLSLSEKLKKISLH